MAYTPAEMNEQIGFLIPRGDGFVIACLDCNTVVRRTIGVDISDAEVPVFRVNVYPYRGTCCRCGKTLVEPQAEAFPELFDGGGFGRRATEELL